MKKLFSLTLAVSILFSLAACSGKQAIKNEQNLVGSSSVENTPATSESSNKTTVPIDNKPTEIKDEKSKTRVDSKSQTTEKKGTSTQTEVIENNSTNKKSTGDPTESSKFK